MMLVRTSIQLATGRMWYDVMLTSSSMRRKVPYMRTQVPTCQVVGCCSVVCAATHRTPILH